MVRSTKFGPLKSNGPDFREAPDPPQTRPRPARPPTLPPHRRPASRGSLARHDDPLYHSPPCPPQVAAVPNLVAPCRCPPPALAYRRSPLALGCPLPIPRPPPQTPPSVSPSPSRCPRQPRSPHPHRSRLRWGRGDRGWGRGESWGAAGGLEGADRG